ncbi:hypothetical protein NMY22_g1024 [Coprinellus aureogranulatus]|nr:hypothetical protein NMY22_g1024 [Coprinellus aureogranulatus]
MTEYARRQIKVVRFLDALLLSSTSNDSLHVFLQKRRASLHSPLPTNNADFAFLSTGIFAVVLTAFSTHRHSLTDH